LQATPKKAIADELETKNDTDDLDDEKEAKDRRASIGELRLVRIK
jgi:hypothetical protein